jgi:hypothetical protein
VSTRQLSLLEQGKKSSLVGFIGGMARGSHLKDHLLPHQVHGCPFGLGHRDVEATGLWYGRGGATVQEDRMIIRIEVSDADLEAMECDSLDEFEEQIRNQLDNGVVTSDGGAGADWMAEYDLEVIKVD